MNLTSPIQRWLEATASALASDKRLLLILAASLLILLIVFLTWPRSRSPYVARLKRLTWKRAQFCRGWLITGDTGSGKTTSGVNQLAHQLFKSEPRWGGLCIDE